MEECVNWAVMFFGAFLGEVKFGGRVEGEEVIDAALAVDVDHEGLERVWHVGCDGFCPLEADELELEADLELAVFGFVAHLGVPATVAGEGVAKYGVFLVDRVSNAGRCDEHVQECDAHILCVEGVCGDAGYVVCAFCAAEECAFAAVADCEIAERGGEVCELAEPTLDDLVHGTGLLAQDEGEWVVYELAADIAEVNVAVGEVVAWAFA